MAREATERARAIPALAEVFREHGYDGASLALITAATGLGKGSLYHAFPGGKDEMAAAVLDHIQNWFDANVYQPLRTDDPARAFEHMFRAVDDYFHSGGRVCIVGVFALGQPRDQFATQIATYFKDWVEALSACLERQGRSVETARDSSEAIVGGIQGALVLARAADDPSIFTRALQRMKASLEPHD
jgi:TetR/AcrR family transcriptional regulator, lmrAB and yxaGH operons repressor